MRNVNSSTTTLTFTAPSLPDGVFTGIVIVMVTGVNGFGIGPVSDPATMEIEGVPSVAICVFKVFNIVN